MSRSLSRILLAALVIVASLGMAACPERTSIAKVQHFPGHFAGKEVTIAGRVVTSFGAMGQGAFQLDDGSGRMWVFSENWGIPGRGAGVAVTGRVEEGFSFRGRNYGMVLRETQRQHERW